MALIIRKAAANDAAGWLQLLREAFGSDAVAEHAYDLNRLAGQLFGPQVEETWVAEADGKLLGSISILASNTPNRNPVANLGRHVFLPGSYRDGSAEALLRGINAVCDQRKQIAILRVASSDNPRQTLLEQFGYVCVGFQPLKHLAMVREGSLFYVRVGSAAAVTSLPLSQSLPQVTELAAAALNNLQIPSAPTLRDGLTGYPLQTDLQITECTLAEYQSCSLDAQALSPPVEMSGHFNRGLGLLRVASETPTRALLGQCGGAIVAGLCFFVDEHDKCMRLVHSFAVDNASPGSLLRHAVALAQEQFSAVYVEADFLITAPRALKSAEQLGFVPVAYLPGFHDRDGCGIDIVKMVKLNAMYSLDSLHLTPGAREIVDIVNRNFQDQKVGVAVINLLRGLPVFSGLGDGELGKIARLFEQKLYRAGERVFNKGDSSNEAFIVMRGQIDIFLEENSKPVASIGSGAIIGEQAFLDGAARNAIGIAAQPSILLMVQRAAFNTLTLHEPQLGMVVMRNIAIEVSNKLRKASAALSVTSR